MMEFVLPMFRQSLLAVIHNETRLRFSLIDTSNGNKLLLVQNRLVSFAKMWK